MINHLKEIVVPKLRELNFQGTFPHFRRMTPERTNLLTFQFDRSGGGFVIEIANCKPGGLTTFWEEEISPNKLTSHDVHIRKRIQSNMNTKNSLTKDWFRYDKRSWFGFGNVYKNACKDVLSKLSIAQEYWKSGELN